MVGSSCRGPSIAWPTLFLVLLSPLTHAAAETVHSRNPDSTSLHLDIKMRGAHPTERDSYICAGYNLEQDEAYIEKFEALASADTAHHILLYGCDGDAVSLNESWQCGRVCGRGQIRKIMFAWAKNAPPTQLPPGVGMRIGQNSSIKSIVIQIHYARTFAGNETDSSGIRLSLATEKPQYTAGVFLMAAGGFEIPPNETKYHVDVSCNYSQDYSIFPFAFRTHAHGLGRVIVGYQVNGTNLKDSDYHAIGKGNPQWPQAFYPSNASVEIKPGDGLVARCTYNSTGVNHTVEVGSTGDDEMCNFYFMFYTNASVPEPSGSCGGVQRQDLVDKMPVDSDVPLPHNSELEAQAIGHHHPHHHPSVITQGPPTTVENHVEAGFLSGPLQYQSDWPPGGLNIGQVGGVATDGEGNVYIFHRGERTWEFSSFYTNNSFQKRNKPIQQHTIIVLSPKGRLIRQFGMGRFFMPHGIEVDRDNNIWLTDVALHQVFKIPAGYTKASLTLGVRFVPGSDTKHFCKPTDVAVLLSGEFFVSDGYCNSRILKFSKDGKLLKQWGQKVSEYHPPGLGEFNIPHSITVGSDVVCVADRENARIQCFDLDGKFKFILQDRQFGDALYAIEYSPLNEGVLFAVNGGLRTHVKGFTFNLPNKTLLTTWNMPPPQSLASPHDVTVDVRNRAVYVGELTPPAVRKFVPRTPGHAATSPFIPPTTTSTTTTTTSTTTTTTMVTTTAASKNGAEDKIKVAAEQDKTSKTEEMSSLTPLLLIGPLVAIPLMLLMTFIIARFCRDYYTCSKRLSNGIKPKMSHRGFDPLLQKVSDDSDSENEMFLQPGRKKGQLSE